MFVKRAIAVTAFLVSLAMVMSLNPIVLRIHDRVYQLSYAAYGPELFANPQYRTGSLFVTQDQAGCEFENVYWTPLAESEDHSDAQYIFVHGDRGFSVESISNQSLRADYVEGRTFLKSWDQDFTDPQNSFQSRSTGSRLTLPLWAVDCVIAIFPVYKIVRFMMMKWRGKKRHGFDVAQERR